MFEVVLVAVGGKPTNLLSFIGGNLTGKTHAEILTMLSKRLILALQNHQNKKINQKFQGVCVCVCV